MENKTTGRHPRPQRVRPPPATGRIAVDFPFDDRAAPSAAEVAVVSAILPDLLQELLATETPKEN